MLKILSIDWDYFFPNDEDYDWGHRESPLFIETLWPLRVNNRNSKGEMALDVHKPSVPTNFWGKVLINKPILHVAESHCDIWPLIDNLRVFNPVQVVNIDAHHDCGYGLSPQKEVPNSFEVDCGNWGYWARKTRRVSKITQFYPAWRQQHPETQPRFSGGRQLNYGLPEPDSYNAVFLCRSGAWTPPWYDDRFQQLIKDSRLKVNGKVPAARGLSMNLAHQQRVEMSLLEDTLRRTA